MKYLLGLFLVGWFIIPVSGQKKWREVDLRINGVGEGTSYSAVIKKIGKPLTIRTYAVEQIFDKNKE